MRRACVSSSSRMICSSRRVLYCFLLDGGSGATTRRVSASDAAGSGDSPRSDCARRLRDGFGAAKVAAASVLCATEGHRGVCCKCGHLPRVLLRAHDRPHLQQRGACTVPTSTVCESTAVDAAHARVAVRRPRTHCMSTLSACTQLHIAWYTLRLTCCCGCRLWKSDECFGGSSSSGICSSGADWAAVELHAAVLAVNGSARCAMREAWERACRFQAVNWVPRG